jgi:hypothetical protein
VSRDYGMKWWVFPEPAEIYGTWMYMGLLAAFTHAKHGYLWQLIVTIGNQMVE